MNTGAILTELEEIKDVINSSLTYEYPHGFTLKYEKAKELGREFMEADTVDDVIKKYVKQYLKLTEVCKFMHGTSGRISVLYRHDSSGKYYVDYNSIGVIDGDFLSYFENMVEVTAVYSGIIRMFNALKFA